MAAAPRLPPRSCKKRRRDCEVRIFAVTAFNPRVAGCGPDTDATRLTLAPGEQPLLTLVKSRWAKTAQVSGQEQMQNWGGQAYGRVCCSKLAFGGCFLLLTVASVIAAAPELEARRNAQHWINISGRQRMLSQRIAKAVCLAARDPQTASNCGRWPRCTRYSSPP